MAVDFNILRREGPANLLEGFTAGQQEATQNALAQQKIAQERDLMSMRRQEFQANLESSQAERRRKAQIEKTAMFRDRLLKASSPQAARDLIRMQHSDPDLGPLMQQFGTLEQDLADIPDDPSGFENWRSREAMGAAEFIRNQASERGFQDLMSRLKGNQPDAGAAAPVNAMAAAPAPVNAMAAASGTTRRTPERIASEIDLLSQSTDPRAKAMAARLMEEYRFALKTPTEVATDPSKRYVPVGKLVFDRETQQWIQPPAGAVAATAEPAAPPVKPLTPAQEAARRDKIGKEYKGASAALQTTQDVLDSLTSVKESPGLPRITGLQSYVPSMPDSPAAVADVRLQNLRGKVTALGKAQAAATGAIGSIANQEWKILSDQIAAIDPSKGQKALLEQLDLIEQQAKGAMERIRDGYERTYGEDFTRFPQFQNIPEPKTTRKPKPSAAPSADGQTPIYARNPKTKERIMSTDGGNTWSPAR